MMFDHPSILLPATYRLLKFSSTYFFDTIEMILTLDRGFFIKDGSLRIIKDYSGVLYAIFVAHACGMEFYERVRIDFSPPSDDEGSSSHDIGI